MLRRFAGASTIASELDRVLPQPDQLCGPFSASVALTAVLDGDIPGVTAIAVASGSAIWPGEIDSTGPPGTPRVTDGWDLLRRAASIDAAGTTAAGLAGGIEAATDHRVAVVPIMGPAAEGLRLLIDRLLDVRLRFGLIANVHTAELTEFDWNVGHFVTVWGFDPVEDVVAIADTYRELGEPDMPPGCRTVSTDAVASAMSERGLLLIVDSQDHRAAVGLVRSLELRHDVWSV